MSVNTPPTENIPIFDASVFPTASGTALTIASGSKYFLTYPVAQGTEIFPSNITLQSTLTDSNGNVGTLGQVLSSTGTGTDWVDAGGIIGNLDLPPPYGLLTDTIKQSASHVSGTDINLYGTTTDCDILFGSTLPSSRTLRICNTTAGSSGGSVHCSNIGFDGANINNATAPAAGTIKIGNSLTSGPLYIGCGSAISTHTSGPIFIGADSTSTGPISIGTNTTSLTTANEINIGSGTYTTKILGPSTTTGILSASGGIQTTSLDTPLSSSVLSIGSTLTNGASAAVVPLLIGININATPTIGIQVGNSSTKIKLEGPVSSGSTITAGTVLIAPLLRNGANTGSISSAGIITGTSFVGPSFNASADTDSVGISTTQTSGVLNIGTGARLLTGSGGAINIGTGSGAVVNPINIGGTASATLLSGVVSTKSDLLTGGTVFTTSTSVLSGKISVEVNSGSRTIVLDRYNKFVLFVNIGTGGGGGTITLPPVSTSIGYSFAFRSVQATATTTVIKDAGDTNNILLTNASAYSTAGAVGSVVITSGNVKTFMSDGSFWVQY